MVLTVTEDTPADMLAGSMELLVQLPRDHNVHTQRVTVPRSTPMMDLLVQIATAHKLSASSYTLQAIGERGLVLPHQPNTPIGALDALQVKLLPKQGTFLPRKTKQANQPFETTFRLQVLLPRNQLYVSRVSPKMNLGKILEDVCNEKNLDKNKYELRHPANVEETLDLSLSLQDYHLQEVMLYAKQGRQLGAALSSQDIMALQRQEERRRQQAKQSVFGFMFRKSKESSLSIDSLGGRSVSPARSDETGRSVSPLAPPSRPLRKRRPAPKPPVRNSISGDNDDESKEKLVISHSRNSSDSSGYHEASVLSDNPDSGARMPETLPRRSKPPCKLETSRKLEQTSQASKSLGNLAIASGGLSHGISSTSISSTGIRKKRVAPPPPIARPLSSAISTQALERIIDSEESLTSDIDISKSPSDIAASSKANSDIGVNSKANSDIGVHSMGSKPSSEIGYKIDAEFRAALADHEDNVLDIERSSMKIPPPARFKQSSDDKTEDEKTFEKTENVDIARLVKRGSGDRTMETDILLQKVSDTLSNSLPIVKSTDDKMTEETKPQEKSLKSITNDESDGIHESFDIFVKTNNVKSTKLNDSNRESLSGKVNLGCSPNATMNSQQDTSDYVSAVGDDLSIADWEYQLPAPPSAFRDNVTPEFDGYDTITLRSVEAFKETVAATSDDEKSAIVDSSLRESPIPPPSIFNGDSETPKFSIMPEEIEESMEKPEKPKSSPQTFELKKEIISELSTKIENGTLPRTSGKNSTVELSAPKIAPVDNTLSNFTITTYSRQKSLNIFEEEEIEEKRNFPRVKKSEEKLHNFVSSATSKRTNENDKENFGSRGALERIVDNFQSESALSRAQSVENMIEPEVEFERSETKPHFTQHDSLLRRTSSSNGQEKSTNVHRSKSYITLANNSKYRGDFDGEKDNGSFRNDNVVSGMMKSTSVTNLNHELPRSNEKFSQWRENILKRQEEPSKEKQLQSLQVLKNILPRLKTPQQTEENIVESSNEKQRFDHRRSNTLSEGESMESKSSASESEAKPQKRTEDATTKRYTYTGPPAINLGSWSERPRANVQLKKDTDYKFGANDNNVTGAKTVINLNGTRIERNDDKREQTLSRSVSKNEPSTHRETHQDRRDSEEDLAKTMMKHKVAASYEKSALNRMMVVEPKSISRIENKPIVTSVALKKTQIEKTSYENVDKLRDDDDVKIDTKPVNFKELTKTFGQEVCLRPKPKRTLQNRHSDYYGTRPEIAQNLTNTNGQTSFWDNADPSVTKFGDSMKNLSNGIQRDATTKRCTSIVRIESHCNNNNHGMENGDTTKNHTTSTKINGPMPVVKGFKMRTSDNTTKIPNVQQENNVGTNSLRKTFKVPIPPTMPIITGVTLKNSTARPKSLQLSNVDPHDQLLESIRNFGGRDRLRSVNI